MGKVYTYGVFDLLHPGHIRLLQNAKKLGDWLIVGVVADHAVKDLKGEDRPIQSLMDRMEIVRNLKMVDMAVIQQSYDPAANIRMFEPDILTKGNDWSNIPGEKLIKEIGGELITLPYSTDFSTSALVNKIRRT